MLHTCESYFLKNKEAQAVKNEVDNLNIINICTKQWGEERLTRKSTEDLGAVVVLLMIPYRL